MQSKIIVLMVSLATCLIIVSGLRAAAEPIAEAPSALTVDQTSAALDIAFAILEKKPNDVTAAFKRIFPRDLSGYKDLQALVINVRNAVDKFLELLTDPTHRSLQNEAGKRFIQLMGQESQRRLEEAQKRAEAEAVGLGQFAELSPDVTIGILEKLPTESLEALVRTSKKLKSIVHPILEKRYQDPIKYWKEAKQITYDSLPGNNQRAMFMAFSSDGTLVSVEKNGAIKLWDVKKRSAIAQISSRPRVQAVAFSPESKLLAISCRDHTISVFYIGASAEDSDELYTFTVVDKVGNLAISSDGKTLAAGLKHTIKLWDLRTGESQEITNFDGTPWSLVFLPDGKTLVVSSIASYFVEVAVSVWNLRTLKQERKINIPQGRVVNLLIFPQGRLIGYGGIGIITIWDVRANKKIGEFHGFNPISFSPDGKLLASFFMKTIELWNLETGEKVNEFDPGEEGIVLLAFSPDSRLLAAGYHDGTIRLWKAGE